MNSEKKRLLLFLGAGASVDAGLPSAVNVTRHLENFSAHTSRPSAWLVENLFRLVQAEIAAYRRVPTSAVDFEAVLGALLDAMEGRNLFSSRQISELLHTRFGDLDLERLVRDLVLYIRGLFLPVRDVGYLDALLHAVWACDGAIATLNYDVSVERRHAELNRPVINGFDSDGRWVGLEAGRHGTELLKLHGSVHWLRQAINLDDPYSILESLVFFAEPFMTGLHKTAAWVPVESRPGVRLLMNIGLSKEQLYVSPPFREIFTRFRARLEEAELLVVAGYSFRDPAVNRMLVESVKRKRIPVVVVDPCVGELAVKRPVVQAFRDYGILVEWPTPVREVSPKEVEKWFEVAVQEAPNSVVTPPGFQDRSAVNRTHDLAVELSILEHYLRLILEEIESGRSVVYGLLNCLVQSVERCVETHYQAVLAMGENVPSRPALHGVYSREAVDLSGSKEDLVAALDSLASVLRRLEASGGSFQISPEGNLELYEDKNLEGTLRGIIDALRQDGVDVH